MDVLNISANERMDLSDLQYTAFTSQLGFQRELVANLFLNPTASQQLWVLNGFNLTNPSGNLLSIASGSAVLAYRDGTNVYNGVILPANLPSQTLDLTSFASGTYGVYIRFNYQLASDQSRVFWNPADAGSEYAQSVPTRQTAVWELRVEVGSPGAEWMQIGQVVTPGVTITDMRPFYFEGTVNSTYAQVWGTGANDRSSDREQYGIRDFHTFVDAMRTCLEDIKGPGLARWWSAGVTGMNIGFTGVNAVAARIALADANFYIQGSTTIPSINFGGTSSGIWKYTRSTNQWEWLYNTTNIATLDATGLAVGTGVTGTSGDVALFLQSVSNGYGQATISNTNATTPGAALQLIASHTYRVRSNTTGNFDIYDVGNSAQRFVITSTGTGNFAGVFSVGTLSAITLGEVFHVDGGSLSSTAATQVFLSRDKITTTNVTSLSSYAYRSGTGASSLTADLYLQRTDDSTSNGFLAFYGNASVGLGTGAAATSPMVLVTSSQVLLGGGTIASSTSQPAQVSAAASSGAFFGANKAGSVGVAFGYANTFTMGSLSNAVGAAIWQRGSDPFYIVTGSTQGSVLNTSGQWGFGPSILPASILGIIHVQATAAGTSAYFDQSAGSQACLVVINSTSGTSTLELATGGTSKFTLNGTSTVFSAVDVANTLTFLSYSNSTQVLSLTSGVTVTPANTGVGATMLSSTGDINAQGGFRQQLGPLSFYLSSATLPVVAGSFLQILLPSGSSMNTGQTTCIGETFTWVAPFSGSVVGLTIFLFGTVATTTKVTVLVNGSAGLNATVASGGGNAQATATKDTYSFSAGQTVEAEVQFGSALTSQTVGMLVYITIEC